MSDRWVFAHTSGTVNPLVLPTFDADGDGRSDAVAPPLWAGALVSAVLGTRLPGAGTRYISQNFRFPDRALVAGRANVLMVPNIEAGNMLAKELAFVAHAEAPGLVVGAKVPIMLTSRADDVSTRLASCAVAVLEAHFRRTGTSAVPLIPAEPPRE